MKCLLCKSGTMLESEAAYFAQLKDCYVIIENVPCWRCDQCGEILYKTSVIERIENILDALEKVSSKIFIVDYSTAA